MNFRDTGAQGALLDEYEKAINELKVVIRPINESALKQIVDTETSDMDCRSIQTILSHVVRAGYGYVVEIRKQLGEDVGYFETVSLDNVEAYEKALTDMFNYNLALFIDYPDLKLEAYQAEEKILVRWGQIYDVEQLFEHAIVHILRHRRQIERFLLKIGQ